jgi:hypothetical protein
MNTQAYSKCPISSVRFFFLGGGDNIALNTMIAVIVHILKIKKNNSKAVKTIHFA